MKSVFSFIAICLVALAAKAEKPCGSPWSVQAERDGLFLHVVLKEVGTQGPACDLTVWNLTYSESSLSLHTTPAAFCPIDAIGERSATLVWQIPYDRRANADLNLWVNGIETGHLILTPDNVTFKGNCQ